MATTKQVQAAKQNIPGDHAKQPSATADGGDAVDLTGADQPQTTEAHR